MRYAIISDIHANYHALEAVLRDLESEEIHYYFCLGDIVGYGAFPNECVSLVRDLGFTTVAGNHDYAAIGKIGIENFNGLAKTATLWTREKLTPPSLEFLNSIPLILNFDRVSVVHGSLYSPELFDYVQTSYEAHLSLAKTKGRICFIGHSHIPVAFIQNPYITYTMDREISVPDDGKALINVGSVGQPRDQDPRSAYAIYDDEQEKVTIRRIQYDIEAAIEAIRKQRLPAALGERLRYGL